MMKNILGISLVSVISLIAWMISQVEAVNHLGISMLTLAIIVGMVVGNTVYSKIASYCNSGVNFSKTKLLRLGIILYGFRLTFQQILDVGLQGILIDVCIVVATFFIALWCGTKLLKIHPHQVILIGSGASICGAAAVMATEGVIKTKSNNVSVAIATVVIFGTLAMFLYPYFYQILLNLTGEISPSIFGVYIGSTIHEVAQVVVAGNAIDASAADTAVITKMIRVMLLAPFLIVLSLWLTGRKQKSHTTKKIVIPWFAVLFIVVAMINSFGFLPQQAVIVLQNIDNVLLMMAMAALGLTTHFRAIAQAGSKPLLLALLLFVWLIIGGGAINYLINLLFH